MPEPRLERMIINALVLKHEAANGNRKPITVVFSLETEVGTNISPYGTLPRKTSANGYGYSFEMTHAPKDAKGIVIAPPKSGSDQLLIYETTLRPRKINPFSQEETPVWLSGSYVFSFSFRYKQLLDEWVERNGHIMFKVEIE